MLKMFRDKILPFIAFLIIKIFSSTHRLKYENTSILSEIKSKKQNIIFAFWHGRQFILVNSHKNKGVCIMSSLSKDGELQAKILTKFGYQIVRGSSSKGGDRALVELIRKMKKGNDVAFAVDGPRGPIYNSKAGVLYLAQKTGNPIVPVATSAKSFWQLKNWDQYFIPKPFTKTVVRYGSPIYAKETENIDDILKILDLNLNKLTKNLDAELQVKK
jgi:hypothetical protein